jgi:hypothetical protein
MQAGKSAEARCQSVLDTQRRCEEDAVKAWAANPSGQIPEADVYAREMNEASLANATRIANTIRAAEPEHAARSTQAARELAGLEAMLPDFADAVLLEDAATVRADLEAAIAKANTLAAKLFGLRSMLVERCAHSAATEVPVSHEMWPAASDVNAAQAMWKAYAARVATNPNATLEN